MRWGNCRENFTTKKQHKMHIFIFFYEKINTMWNIYLNIADRYSIKSTLPSIRPLNRLQVLLTMSLFMAVNTEATRLWGCLLVCLLNLSPFWMFYSLKSGTETSSQPLTLPEGNDLPIRGGTSFYWDYIEIIQNEFLYISTRTAGSEVVSEEHIWCAIFCCDIVFIHNLVLNYATIWSPHSVLC